LVHEAGAKIGMNAEDSLLDDLVDKLQKEFIVHEWQVARLDSFQWQALGAPMGLAVAMQALVEEAVFVEQIRKPKRKESQRFSSGLTSRPSVTIDDNDQLRSSMQGTTASIRKNPRKTMIKPFLFNRHAPVQRSEGRPPTSEGGFDKTEDGNDDDAVFERSDAREGPEPKEQSDTSKPSNPMNEDSCTPKQCCGKNVATCFSSMMKGDITVENTSCFVMSKLFDQALLHSKSGSELKAHTMFVIELSVVASALFLGAAIELWGAFPLDSVSDNYMLEGGVPQALAFAFNLTSALLIICQLLSASAWIWSLRVISSVASTKFHTYTVETRHFSDYINQMSMFGFALFALDLFLLLAGMSLATTDNWIVNGVALGVTLIVFVLGCIGCHKITSFLGRVTYHGMLMMPDDPSPSTQLARKPEDSHFKKREDMLHQKFERNSILNENKALDAYSQTLDPDLYAYSDEY